MVMTMSYLWTEIKTLFFSENFLLATRCLVLCQSPRLYVSGLLGPLIEEHLDVLVSDVLLDLLNPLVRDGGGRDDQRRARGNRRLEN